MSTRPSYNHVLGIYQGELIAKDVYARRFMDLRMREVGYDFSKIEVVIESLVGECSAISVGRLEAEHHSADPSVA